jgi:hypothetical protein
MNRPSEDAISPFLTSADLYLACSRRHGRDLALETITEMLLVASRTVPETRMFGKDALDREITTTVLHMSDGSTARHTSWHQSFDGWNVEVEIDGGRHGDLRIEIRTGSKTVPSDIMPDHASEDVARSKALRAIECMRLHLEVSMSSTEAHDPETEAAAILEADVAAAHAEEPFRDDVVHVRHATPWERIRAMDSEPFRDLLDEDAAAAMNPDVPTRLSVSANADGGHVVLQRIERFADVPDALSRLRTLAATTRRIDP